MCIRDRHRQLEGEPLLLVVQRDRDDVGVDRVGALRADQVRHIVDDAAVIPVGDLLDLRRGGDRVTVVAIVGVALALGADDDIGVEGVKVDVVGDDHGLGALVGEVDPQARVEEGHLLEAGPDRLVVEVDGLEDLGIGPEGHRRAGRVPDLLHLAQRCHRDAVVEGHPEDMALLAHRDVQAAGQGVDDRGADAVQAAGDLVAPAPELAAGVQLGEDELDCADALGRVDICLLYTSRCV